MRSLDAAMARALGKPETEPVLLVEMYLGIDSLGNPMPPTNPPSETPPIPEVPVRMTNAHFDLSFNGDLYLATNGLLSVGQITETKDLIISSLSIALTGINTDHFRLLLQQRYINKELNVYFGVLIDKGGKRVLADGAYKIFSGSLDQPSIKDDPEKGTTILIKATNVWGDYSKKTGRFFNSAIQDIFYPVILENDETARVVEVQAVAATATIPAIPFVKGNTGIFRRPKDKGFDYANQNRKNLLWGRV